MKVVTSPYRTLNVSIRRSSRPAGRVLERLEPPDVCLSTSCISRTRDCTLRLSYWTFLKLRCSIDYYEIN